VLRLVTIPISHYCEKARWALDLAGLPFAEERHVQVVHVVAARRAGGGRTTPVLVTPERAIGSSQEIVAWADAHRPPAERIFPADPAARDEVERLCRRFDERLGPAGRRLVYVHMLRDRPLLLETNDQGVPAWEDAALRRGFVLAADLTLAALSAPVTAPSEYGVALPQPERMRPETRALVERARAHPAGAFALRVFAAHRRPPRTA